jgi:putative exosortase-associated protein (TIGR04073 family)
MKSLRKLIAVFVLLLTFPLLASAAEIAAPGTAARKLQRGFLNVALSPAEVSNEIMKLKRIDTALPSWIAGMAIGIPKMVTRSMVGIYEVVTAPVPLPSGYEPVMMPEFTWEYTKPLEEVPAEA